MKLSELMNGHTPDTAFEGFVTADDMVLAIDVSAEQKAEVGDYAVVQVGIEGVDPICTNLSKAQSFANEHLFCVFRHSNSR